MNQKNLWNRNFTIMTIGQFISLFGNSLQRFAMSLLILDLTGSAAIFSIILALTFIPQVVIAPFGGAIADRVSKKRIMVYLDLFSGVLLLGFSFYHQTIGLNTVTIGILMCTLAVIQSIYDPSVRAAIPAVTCEENLSNANAVVSVVSSLTALLGPIAAGCLYGIYGVSIIFIINIVSFIFSGIMEIFLHIPHKKVASSGSVLKTFCQDIKATCHYLTKEKPLIFQTMLVSCSFNLFLTPIYTVGLPFMEKIIFKVSDQLYGISEGCVGAGMIIGALLTGVLSKKLPFSKLYCYFVAIIVLVFAMGFTALPFVMVSSGTSILSYILFTSVGFIFAMVLAVVNILCMTYMQKEIPMEYMGKSMALVTAASTSLMPVGQIIFGGLYDLLASRTSIIYLVVGICSIIATIVTYRLMLNAKKKGLL